MNYEQIEISKINRSSYNPRRVFDDSKIAELAHNIREQGLLQPITVRPIANGYEIVCGERRWRAFQWNIVHGYTGYLTMPCIVREMTDDEAFDAAITENLQRQDVEPMDEAIAFNQLLDRGQSIADLVARFGKSASYIRSRLSLNKLIPELAEKIGEDDFGVQAATLASSLTESQQKEYLEDYGEEELSVASVRSYTRGISCKLADAPYPETYEGYCGVTCSRCANNSANEGCLFRQCLKSEDARCLRPDMYRAKVEKYIHESIEALGDKVLKEGEDIVPGKIVLVKEYVYDAQLKKKISEIEACLGVKIVDAWTRVYEKTAEEMEEELAQGRAVECYDITFFSRLGWKRTILPLPKKYVASDDSVTEKSMLVYEIEQLKKNQESRISWEMYEAAQKITPPSGDLTEAEKKMLLLFFMADSTFKKGVVIGDMTEDEWAERNVIHFEYYFRCYVRDFLMGYVRGSVSFTKIYDVVREWDAAAFNNTYKLANAKIEGEIKRRMDKLREMGFDESGKKLEDDERGINGTALQAGVVD